MKMLGKLSPPFSCPCFSYYGFTNYRKIHLGCDNLGFVCMWLLLEHKKLYFYCNICSVLCYVQNNGVELENLFLKIRL